MEHLSLGTSLDINDSFVEDIQVRTYKYNNIYIEDLQIDSLKIFAYRHSFFKFLQKCNVDNGEYQCQLFIELLLLRIKQKSDTDAYVLLDELYKDPILGESVADNELKIYQLFLMRCDFFIKSAYSKKCDELLLYINRALPPALFSSRLWFKENLAELPIHGKMLLIDSTIVSRFSLHELRDQIMGTKTIEIFFSPSYNTEWQGEMKIYYDVNPLFASNLSKLELGAYEYYTSLRNSQFPKYIIQNIYKVVDQDGFSNLREAGNSMSKVIQMVPNGTHVEIINDNGEWWKVKVQNAIGYIYFDRLASIE